MLREATYHLAAVNVLDVSSESMAAFQAFRYARFWVFTEALERFHAVGGSKGPNARRQKPTINISQQPRRDIRCYLRSLEVVPS